jgi:vacuolar-type H+-ATPase subunit E/Vma4
MSDLQGRKEKLKKRINDARNEIEKLKKNGLYNFKKIKLWNITKIDTLEYILKQLEKSINNESEEEILNIYEKWLGDIETIINELKKTLQPKQQLSKTPAVQSKKPPKKKVRKK